MIYATEVDSGGECVSASQPCEFSSLDELVELMGPPSWDSGDAVCYGRTVFSERVIHCGQGRTYLLLSDERMQA